MKLNVGCGTDIREGFVNIDGGETIGADKVIDLNSDSLRSHFDDSSCEFILANDIVEHFFRWEAIAMLKDFHALLRDGGEIEIKCPDCEYIINSGAPIERKLLMLYGGQDRSGWWSSAPMDKTRAAHPEFFCHKFGWTQPTMKKQLEEIGFHNVRMHRVHTDFVTRARK